MELKEVVGLLLQLGGWGAFIIIVILVVQDPERVNKFKIHVIKPFFDFFRWGSRQYLALQVGSASTEFIRHNLLSMMPEMATARLRIKWVKDVESIVGHADGTLILRMRETNDQTRNILSAIRVAIPRLVCVKVRTNLNPTAACAIDLALVRKMANSIGMHAYPVFQKHFLEPEFANSREAAELFSELVELDESGYFISVFLNELNRLGEYLASRGDSRDRTDSVMELLRFVLAIARRGHSDEVRLSYITQDFRVAVLLLAKSYKMDSEGLRPYLNRLTRNLDEGAESIYVVSFSNAISFYDRLLKAVDGDLRLEHRATFVTKKASKYAEYGPAKVGYLRRIHARDELDFSDFVTRAGIELGSIHRAEIVDVAESYAVCAVRGVTAYIPKIECAWGPGFACNELLKIGQFINVLVKEMDSERQQLIVSVREAEGNPWEMESLPEVGSRVSVNIRARFYNGYACVLQGSDLSAILPRTEISWFSENVPTGDDLLGKEFEAKVTGHDQDNHALFVSVRQLSPSPWEEIHKALSVGTRLTAFVTAVTQTAVLVELPNAIYGYIPDSEMRKGGYEYSEYQEHLVIGQALEVVVTKVFIVKQKIRLSLARVIEVA